MYHSLRRGFDRKANTAQHCGVFWKERPSPTCLVRGGVIHHIYIHFRLTTFPGTAHGPGWVLGLWKSYYNHAAFPVRDFEVSSFCCVIILPLQGRA